MAPQQAGGGHRARSRTAAGTAWSPPTAGCSPSAPRSSVRPVASTLNQPVVGRLRRQLLRRLLAGGRRRRDLHLRPARTRACRSSDPRPEPSTRSRGCSEWGGASAPPHCAFPSGASRQAPFSGPVRRCPDSGTARARAASGPDRNGEPVTATDETTPTIADVDRLVAWMDAEGLGTGAPLEHRYISGGSQNEIYELRRGDLHGAMRIPPPSAPAERDAGIVREWRIIEALNGTDVPHTEAIAVCTDPAVLGRTFYLMGFVDGWSPMGMERRVARAVRHRPRGAPGPGLPAGGGHRPAVQGRLEGQGAGGPRPSRRLPRAPGGPLDRLLRAHQGTRAAGLRRGLGLAAGPQADSTTSRDHARRLPVRQRDVQGRGAGAAGRHRRLGDGHRGRPQARPRLGRALLARGHERRRGQRRRLRRHDRHAVAGRGARALLRAVGPSGRRHRLLLRARQVEAGHRARAGLPAGGRRPQAPGVRRRWSRPDGRAPPSWPRPATT